MRFQRRFKFFQRLEAHQPRQPQPGRAVFGNGVGLLIFLHLQAMLDVAEKAVGGVELLRLLFGEQFVLREFGEARQRLRGLQKRQPSGVQDLQRLDDEFDFANAAAPQLDVALQFFRAAPLPAQSGP